MLRDRVAALNRNSCYGCFACQDICPKQCISTCIDADGFYYPQIDETICVNCYKCESVCPVIHPVKVNPSQKTFAAQSKDLGVLQKSASGGVFGTIAELIVEQGGVAYGCAMCDCEAVHTRIEDTSKLDALRGSRYVQSNPSGCYSSCKQDLDAGRFVVFSGTPCQIGALRSFLGREYENLFAIDLICHGVGSPGFFSQCKEDYEKRFGVRVINVNFRSKKNGWGLAGTITALSENGDLTTIDYHSNMHPYYHYYLDGDYFRRCCYSCRYSCGERVGDISIGDFWGIEIIEPGFPNIDKGVSVLVVNDEMKWNAIGAQDRFILSPHQYEDAAKFNAQMVEASIRVKDVQPGYQGRIKEFYSRGVFGRMIRKVYYSLPSGVAKGLRHYYKGVKSKLHQRFSK